MAAGSTQSEERYLKIGDTVLLYVSEPSGYVYSELSSSVYNLVSVFPADQDTRENPAFPNVAFATFKIIAPNKYRAQKELVLLQEQMKDEDEDELKKSQIELAIVKKKVKVEQEMNSLEQQKKHGCVVMYGDSIQLVHVGSKNYISLSSEYTSRTESNNLLVHLTKENSQSCIFKILPRYKIKSEGDLVKFGDQIKIQSVRTQGQFLHCSQVTLESVKESQNSDVSQPLEPTSSTKQSYPAEDSHTMEMAVQGSHYEMNLSALETTFTLIPHFSPTKESAGALRAGCCVRLFHREGECYVVAEGSFAENGLVEKVHCRERKVDQKGHSMPSTSANTYWQIEKESGTINGDVIYWEERCRIRHLPTRMYLTVERNKEGNLIVNLKKKGEGNDTLFSFYPLIKEGEIVLLESYSRIKHLISDTWLHLDEQLRYERDARKPFSKDKGLAGIQWDFAELFELTSCESKGDYDAFTLQEVEEDLINKFNYVAGVLPVLRHYRDSVGDRTVNVKTGAQVKTILYELCSWLDDCNGKKAKDKQKLMRNLRVLEQLHDILITELQTKDSGLIEIHKDVCRECYSVLSQYLKGDSRKNENYIARFIESFLLQVGKGLNAEEFLVEIVQDNYEIISRMAKTKIDAMIHQLQATMDPRFLTFLSSLCVCSGKPIPSTQLAILKRLVEPHGAKLFVKTQIAVSEKKVICTFRNGSGTVRKPIDDLQDPNEVEFQFLKAQLQLFAQLCKGKNDDVLEVLKQDSKSEEGFVITFDEAFKCAESTEIHKALKCRYVELILVMFVAVGDNRSFLDHLCYSFVYSELSATPYEKTGSDDKTALTGVTNNKFPDLKKWILKTIRDNKVLVCDEQHIAHNEALAQVLDLLCHLINYGYYDAQDDINALLNPLYELLDGTTDIAEKEGSDELKENVGMKNEAKKSEKKLDRKKDAEATRADKMKAKQKVKKEGRLKNTKVNGAVFAVKKRALDAVRMFMKFKSYVHLQVFIHHFQVSEKGHDLESRAVREQLKQIWNDSSQNKSATAVTVVPQRYVREILIDLSKYENDDLVRNSLKLLTTMHFQDDTLFSRAAHTQLLIAKDSLTVSEKIKKKLPKLRHLLSIECSIEQQWKIVKTLVEFTKHCTRDNGEPHSENQLTLYNYDVLSDILSYVMAKDFQQHMKVDDMPVIKVPQKGQQVSQQVMTREVLRNCFVFLRALAYNNELVQMRIFERIYDLLKIRVAMFALADLLTEIFASSAKASLKVDEQVVNFIFQAIVESHGDHYTQTQLLISLQALAKNEELDLPMDSHQVAIVNNFRKYRHKIGENLLGGEHKKAMKRWKLLTNPNDDDAELKLLLSLTDLLATCAEGDNIFIESVCQTLLPLQELIQIISWDSDGVDSDSVWIPCDRKRPFVRFLVWVYIDTDGDRNVTEGATLAHNMALWNYFKQVAEFLCNLQKLLESATSDIHVGSYKRALVASVCRRTYSLANGCKVVPIPQKVKNLPFFATKDGSLKPGILEYFTEGIVPFLYNFFDILVDRDGKRVTCDEKSTTVELGRKILKLIDDLMRFISTDTQLQQFKALVLTICRMPMIKNRLTIDQETYNELAMKKSERKKSPHRSRNQAISHDTSRIYHEQSNKNEAFHKFVTKWHKAFQGQNTVHDQIGSKIKECYCSEGEELPLSQQFQELVKLYCSVKRDNIMPVIQETECLLKQLEISVSCEKHLSEDEQQEQDLLDIRCLQVLRALIHNKIKMIDPEEEDSNPEKYRSQLKKHVNPVQVAIQKFGGNAVKMVLPLLSHQNKRVSNEAIFLLRTLLFSGNKTVQMGLERISEETREEQLFLFLQSKLRQSAIRYREIRFMRLQLIKRVKKHELFMERGSMVSSATSSSDQTNLPTVHAPTQMQTAVPIDDDKTGLLRAPSGIEMNFLSVSASASPSKEQPSPGNFQMKTLMANWPSQPRRQGLLPLAKFGADILDLGAALKQETDTLAKIKEHKDSYSAEVQETIALLQNLQKDTSIKVVLEVIGLMCDGQRRSMQDYLRHQPDNFKSVNVVAEVAEFLQAYTKGLSPDNYVQIEEVFQALIEVCVGNPDNQRVVLDKQVVEPINVILGLASTAEKGYDTEALDVKVKVVELLQVMLENTSKPHSAAIREQLKERVDKKSLADSVCYFQKMTMEPAVKKDKKDDDATRGKFQCYHALVALADDDMKEKIACADVETLRKKSRSVEIRIKHGTDKPHLATVHFIHDPENNLREELVKKVKWNIDRDSMENKQRELCDLFEPLKKDLKRQQLLRSKFISRVIIAFPELRHWLLLFLTLLLNLFVLFLFTLRPEFINPPANSTRPFIAYAPNVQWLRIPLYLFGSIHLVLAIWMFVEYFLINYPHFRFPKEWIKLIPGVDFFYLKKNNTYFKKPFLTSVNILGLNTIWVMVFLACSVLSLVFFGYFYCICMLHIVFNNDPLKRVLRAVTKNGVQLVWVALLIVAVLLIYSVISFAFLWDRFYPLDSNRDVSLYCDTLFQCFVTVVRYGLIDNLGLVLPLDVMANEGNRPPFYLAGWRLLFDVSFFVIVTTIGLNIVFGIIVETFDELRQERSKVEEEQKSKCFICDKESHEFERNGKGFDKHVQTEHNMWDYVYYAQYLDTIDTNNHTAIQKYVHDEIEKKKSRILS